MARTRDLWKNAARRGHGKHWLAVWTGENGTEQSEAFDRKIDAERYGTAMEADLLRGVYVDPRRGTMLARDYGEQKFLSSLEATGLTVPRVNFLQRRIMVVEQAQNGALAPLKARASRRTVPADDWVLAEVTAHLQRYGTGPGQVIMSNAAGNIVRRNAFGDIWRAAVKAAGLPQGTRYHALRHFYASALIAANLNPKVIQSRLGHAAIAETMDTFGHLFPDSAVALSSRRSAAPWRNRNGTEARSERTSAGQRQGDGRAGL